MRVMCRALPAVDDPGGEEARNVPRFQDTGPDRLAGPEEKSSLGDVSRKTAPGPLRAWPGLSAKA